MLFFFLLFSLHSKPLELSLTARTAILMNADTGAILYEKESHAPAYPASVTKMASALYVLESQKLQLQDLVTISAEMLKAKSDQIPWGLIPDGTKMGLVRGEEVSVEALLYGLLLISGNDAANALAEAQGGSIPRFVEELNHYLYSQVGCRETHFCNPHGIHLDDHVTSAYDLALIAQRALRIPQFRQIVATPVYHTPATNKRLSAELRQSNALLRPGPHYYPKAIGVKTGYISQAMNTLVAAAQHEGRTLIAVLLGCPDRSERYDDAIRLFEAAFQETRQTRRLLGPERVFTHDIPKARKPLQAILATDLFLSFFSAEEPVCKAVIQWDPLSLPIKKGQKVGELHILDARQATLQKSPLFAKEEVKKKFFSFF